MFKMEKWPLMTNVLIFQRYCIRPFVRLISSILFYRQFHCIFPVGKTPKQFGPMKARKWIGNLQLVFVIGCKKYTYWTLKLCIYMCFSSPDFSSYFAKSFPSIAISQSPPHFLIPPTRHDRLHLNFHHVSIPRRGVEAIQGSLYRFCPWL